MEIHYRAVHLDLDDVHTLQRTGDLEEIAVASFYAHILNKAPCRCARKTKTFMNYGFLDRNNLTFRQDYVASIGEVASRDAGVVFEKVTGPALYRDHPFLDPSQLKERLSGLLHV